MLGTVYKTTDACIPSELWVVGEVKQGQTTLVPSTVVSAKATDTLGSDTPGKDLRSDAPGKDLRRALR